MANIIDGIDVSSCTYHNTTYKDFECVNAHLDNECKNNPNCYYKQLKRAEQENEKLKEENNKLYARNSKLKASVNYFKRDAISSQNEALTLRGEIYHNELNHKEELEKEKALKETYLACYKAKHNDIEGKMFTYKQALEDIREICKLDCGDCKYNQDCECNFEECEELKLEDIITKINEVIGAEECQK